jgi:iron complex outermembrane receptor protein
VTAPARTFPRLTALALALTTQRAAALDAPAPGSESTQDNQDERIEVVVRGSQASAFASRVTPESTPREPIDAASILAELPSVHVRRLGADGSFGALSIRGSASTQVAVVLAGVPLTSGADPSVDVGSLPLWPGAVFRVYRSFAPASLGETGYLGGLVAIDPPSPLAGERTAWWAAAGSFGALKLRAADARRLGPVSLATGVAASRSDGDFRYELSDPATGRLEERTRTNAGHVAVSGLERASVDGEWGSAGVTLFADARRQGLAGTAYAPTIAPKLHTSRIVAGADARLRAGASGAVHAALWGRREAARFTDPLGELSVTRPTAAGEDAIEATGGSIGVRGRPLERATVDLFASARGERFVPTASRVAPRGTRATRLAAGLGADVEWRATDALRLVVSGRFDARRDDADGARGPGGAPLGETADAAPTGHVGVAYRAGDALEIAAHAGALGRPPSFVELYGDRGALLGDPSLRPERALSADVGASGQVRAGRAALGYEAAAFATLARDLIALEELGQGTLLARNVDRATLAGAELTLSLAARGVRTSASYTALLTENTGDAPLTRGRPLPGRPAHDLAYDASYRAGPLELRYALDAIAGTTADAAGRVELPARFFHGAGASLDVPRAEGLRVGLQIDNLLDLRTQHIPSGVRDAPVAVPVSDFLGYPLPGRTIWVTASFTRARP